MSTTLDRWLIALSGGESALEKLRAKIVHNLSAGVLGFTRKGARFVLTSARSRYCLRRACRVGVGVRVVGLAPKIESVGGQLLIGDDVVFAAQLARINLEIEPGAVLTIGDETYLNDGAWLGCTGAISIGKRVLIGPGVRIYDNSYHDLHQRRVRPPPRPVTIEDDVWLATNAIVLAGVTIGRGSVVGASTVVSKDVPPYTVIAGSPAQVRMLVPQAFDSGSRRVEPPRPGPGSAIPMCQNASAGPSRHAHRA